MRRHALFALAIVASVTTCVFAQEPTLSVSNKMAPFMERASPEVRKLLDDDAYADLLFTDRAAIFGSDVRDPLVEDRSRSATHDRIGSAVPTGDQFPCDHIPRDGLAVLLIAGQSNAHNTTQPNDLYFPHRPFFNLNINDGQCYLAGAQALGTTGEGSAFALPLGDELIDSGLFAQVLIVPIAIGGTYIEEWRPDGGRYFARFERAIRQLAALQLAPTFVLWHQGEGNAGPLITKKTFGLFGANFNHRPVEITPDLREAAKLGYMRHFFNIVARLRALGVSAPVMPAVVTICGTRISEPAIRAAQESLPDSTWGIYQGPNTDMIDLTARYDFCHFNSRGIQLVARQWSRLIRDLVK
jgi:hypothetical protein